MSVARMIAGHSDVYVYNHNGGYVHCCFCKLAPPDKDGFKLHTDDDVLFHLGAHRDAGHLVPDYVFEYFRKPKEQRE